MKISVPPLDEQLPMSCYQTQPQAPRTVNNARETGNKSVRGGGGGGGGSPIKTTGLLVGIFLKNPLKVPESRFVGVTQINLF